MSKQLDSIAAGLHDAGELKVWSLIITFFGDSIIGRGGNVSASTVQSVLSRVEVGSGAIRTAFSRLASDGWIVREKQGRHSFYQLTDEGRSPFSHASKKIYSPINSVDNSCKNWLLGMHQDKSAILDLPIESVIILPNLCVLIRNPDEVAHRQLSDRAFLTITGDCGDIPQWIVEHLISSDWVSQFDNLRKQFKKLSDRVPTDPLAALVARTLLIHQWRRLLLRYPSLPPELKGGTLQAENNCREFVGRLYLSLNDSAEQWLSESGSCLSGGLPKPDHNHADRFTKRYLT